MLDERISSEAPARAFVDFGGDFSKAMIGGRGCLAFNLQGTAGEACKLF